MIRVLNVAEKNDIARSVSELLSNGRYDRHESYSKYNKIYEFDMDTNQFDAHRRVRMVVTSVSGHLLNYEFTDQVSKNWSTYPIGHLFEAPVEKLCNPNMTNIKRTLENEAKKAQYLVIWTDCDREGENIGFEIIDICRRSNRRLGVKRARFSEITRAAIFRAVQNLVNPNEAINQAVECRQELDLRIGAAFTRFQTLLGRKEFPAQLNNMLISYGTCQFPTLGFVVERYKQNLAFVAETFWKLVVFHKKPRDRELAIVNDEELSQGSQKAKKSNSKEIKVEFNWARIRLFDRLACEILHMICNDNPTATVENVVKKPKTKRRPVALETVTLEKNASKKLRMNARRTMDIAQRLYTKGYISYPRTETNQFSRNVNLAELVRHQVADPQWGEFASRVLDAGPNPHNGNKSDEAHPPIHPLKFATPMELQNDDRQVYEYIVRHFLACLSDDARGFETQVHIDVAGEKFHANGLIIVERNYLDVYPYENWSDKELPDYAVGEKFRPSSIDLVEGLTNAPPLLTEADLIALMEKHGIGTDATHADHIEKVKDRKYMALDPANRFVPGFLGLGLVEGYDSMGHPMARPNLRAELERNLVDICEGRKRKDDVLREQLTRYKVTFERAYNDTRNIVNALAEYFGPRANRNALPPPPRDPPPQIRGGFNGNDDDDDNDHGGGGPPPAPADVALMNNNARGGDVEIDNRFLCNCGEQPMELTVKKSGPNCGRKFFKCAQNVCRFFAWSTNRPPDSGTGGGSRAPALPMTSSVGGAASRRNQWMQPNVMMDKPPSGCNEFFPVNVKWSTGTANNRSPQKRPGQNRGGAGGKKKFGTMRSEGQSSKNSNAPQWGGVSGRKCSSCRQPGHTVTRCPNRL